jgi:VCBS repeat-containing protein
MRRLAIIALLSAVLLSAKTYSFTIHDSATAGTVQLKPGDYKLKLDGSQVLLTDNNGEQIDTGAAVQTGERKYDHTSILTSVVDGTNRVVAIEIGGTKTMIVFESAGGAGSQLPN